MKLIWVRWAGGDETRDDGFTIYHDPRFATLRFPDGKLQKFRTAEQAKKAVEEIAPDKISQGNGRKEKRNETKRKNYNCKDDKSGQQTRDAFRNYG